MHRIGTPALSRPIELFTQLHSLAPKDWPDEKVFGKRYCNRQHRKADKKKGAGANWTEFKGASNTQELHFMLTGMLIHYKR